MFASFGRWANDALLGGYGFVLVPNDAAFAEAIFECAFGDDPPAERR